MLLLAEPFIPGDMVTFQRNGVRYETTPYMLNVTGLLVCIDLTALIIAPDSFDHSYSNF